jgi:hypothetical protein
VYYYHEFTRKLLESHPESGTGNYLEGTGNSGLPCMAISVTQSSKIEFADWLGVLAQPVVAERFSTILEKSYAWNNKKK